MADEKEFRQVPEELREALRTLYPRLRQEARRLMSRERLSHTLQPTALVHETVLRLWRHSDYCHSDPDLFLGLAIREMRRILCDYARRVGAVKRGQGLVRVDWEDRHGEVGDNLDNFIALNTGLERLGELDPSALQVVELRFIAGYTVAETAAALGIGRATVETNWQFARLWLYRYLTENR